MISSASHPGRSPRRKDRGRCMGGLHKGSTPPPSAGGVGAGLVRGIVLCCGVVFVPLSLLYI